MRVPRTAVLIVTAAAFVAAAVGCGSGADSSTDTAPASTATSPAQAGGPADRASRPSTSSKSSGATGDTGADTGSRPRGDSSQAREVAQAEREEAETGDQSIQTYGSEPDEGESDEVVAAMRSFVKAMGAGDFGAVCEAFSSQMKKQLEAFLGAQRQKIADSCPGVLEKLIPKVERRKARRVLDGVVTRVRVKDDTAFVLVKPSGEKVSYFVLAREDGRWKATSTALGVPLIP